jgi:hypothetical protein
VISQQQRVSQEKNVFFYMGKEYNCKPGVHIQGMKIFKNRWNKDKIMKQHRCIYVFMYQPEHYLAHTKYLSVYDTHDQVKEQDFKVSIWGA